MEQLKNLEYCINVVGHTDRTGFASCKGQTACNRRRNQELSEKRAQAITNVLRTKFDINKIRAYGRGQDECYTKKADDVSCRKVVVTFDEGRCRN